MDKAYFNFCFSVGDNFGLSSTYDLDSNLSIFSLFLGDIDLLTGDFDFFTLIGDGDFDFLTGDNDLFTGDFDFFRLGDNDLLLLIGDFLLDGDLLLDLPDDVEATIFFVGDLDLLTVLTGDKSPSLNFIKLLLCSLILRVLYEIILLSMAPF